MNIGILGSGIVGETLANGFIKYGNFVKRGSREPQKLKEWISKAGSNASAGTFEESAQFGEIVILSVKGTAAEDVIKSCAKNLQGKIVIDTTNPVANEPPINGVLKFFTNFEESLMEKLQKISPDSYFVKAFSSVGSHFMVNPDFQNIKPTMFICGNHDPSKLKVSEMLTQFGWESADMGKVEAARAIEPLSMLWCIPGFRSNEWNHAFKLLKTKPTEK